MPGCPQRYRNIPQVLAGCGSQRRAATLHYRLSTCMRHATGVLQQGSNDGQSAHMLGKSATHQQAAWTEASCPHSVPQLRFKAGTFQGSLPVFLLNVHS